MPEDPLEVPSPGSLTVGRWIEELFSPTPTPTPVMWSLLDDPLRLALAQGWLMTVGAPRDLVLADELAQPEPVADEFPSMLADLVEHWRGVYEALENGAGILQQTIIAGVDMELVVLTAPEHIGVVTANVPIPVHSFITGFDLAEWRIAATARRLPVPGWPPSEEEIPGLLS